MLSARYSLVHVGYNINDAIHVDKDYKFVQVTHNLKIMSSC